jgi:hypothetical protein
MRAVHVGTLKCASAIEGPRGSPTHHAIAPKSKKMTKKQNVMLVVNNNAVRPFQISKW